MSASCQDRPRSHAHAAETLADVPFLVYAVVQAIKLFLSLVGKRWPHLV